MLGRFDQPPNRPSAVSLVEVARFGVKASHQGARPFVAWWFANYSDTPKICPVLRCDECSSPKRDWPDAPKVVEFAQKTYALILVQRSAQQDANLAVLVAGYLSRKFEPHDIVARRLRQRVHRVVFWSVA
ncbi:MAG TPA: hypothetical protein VJT50_11280 [Pyrinomonadaceae bacterium]|nr:hypothetical protein [Pyrinomonadaceae bacterium]